MKISVAARPRKFIGGFVPLALGLFLGALSGCNIGDQAFYAPNSRVYSTPTADQRAYEEVKFKSADGTVLTGWFIPATAPVYGTVVEFHGNSLNMSANYAGLAWLPKNGFNLFMFDYRGYGGSGGTPSEEGLYEDGVAALRYVKARTDIDQNKIIVYGQSLGASLAVSVVGDNHFDGLVGVAEESGFASRPEIARDRFTWLAGFFVRDSHSAIEAVSKISPVPLLIVHSTGDPVVLYHHGQELFAAAREPKEMWTLDGSGHMSLLYDKNPPGAGMARLRKKFLEWVGAPAAAMQP